MLNLIRSYELCKEMKESSLERWKKIAYRAPELPAIEFSTIVEMEWKLVIRLMLEEDI